MRELSRHCLCDTCDGEDCKDLPGPRLLRDATLDELKEEIARREQERDP